MIDNKVVGERLRQLRKQRKKTMKEVADTLNIPPSTLGMYERGKRRAVDENKYKLCSYYNVSIDEIFFASKKHTV